MGKSTQVAAKEDKLLEAKNALDMHNTTNATKTVTTSTVEGGSEQDVWSIITSCSRSLTAENLWIGCLLVAALGAVHGVEVIHCDAWFLNVFLLHNGFAPLNDWRSPGQLGTEKKEVNGCLGLWSHPVLNEC